MISARHTTNRQSFKKVTCPFKMLTVESMNCYSNTLDQLLVLLAVAVATAALFWAPRLGQHVMVLLASQPPYFLKLELLKIKPVEGLSVQGLTCPGSDLSRIWPIQGLFVQGFTCPGCVCSGLSRVWLIQGLTCPGFACAGFVLSPDR